MLYVHQQTLAEFLLPPWAGGAGAECLLILGNDGVSPCFLKEQLIAAFAAKTNAVRMHACSCGV